MKNKEQWQATPPSDLPLLSLLLPTMSKYNALSPDTMAFNLPSLKEELKRSYGIVVDDADDVSRDRLKALLTEKRDIVAAAAKFADDNNFKEMIPRKPRKEIILSDFIAPVSGSKTRAKTPGVLSPSIAAS